MADYTKVFRAIWRDRDFLALPASAQRTYQMLATQPNINSAGVLTLAAARWATYAPDTTIDDINRDLDILEARRFVVIDRNTDELMVRTLIIHDELYKQRNGPRSIEIAMSEVLSDTLANVIVEVAARVGVTLEPRVKPAQEPAGGPTPESLPIPHPHPVPSPLPLSSADKSAESKTDPTFAAFWAMYPRKEGKGAAETAFKRARKHATAEAIVGGLERLLPSLHQRHAEGFCVQPTRWLNERRWTDEPAGTRRPTATTTAAARSSGRARLAELEALARHEHDDDPKWAAIEAAAE